MLPAKAAILGYGRWGRGGDVLLYEYERPDFSASLDSPPGRSCGLLVERTAGGPFTLRRAA